MSYDEFVEKIYERVMSKVDENKEVRLQEVPKNNGVILKGVTILDKEYNISPTIYLEGFYESFKRGATIEDVVEDIFDCYRRGIVREHLDMSFFREFDKVKERIVYRLISTEQNKDLLERIPHVEYLDLSICFYYAFESESIGNGIINIFNTHMEMWDTTAEELYELAKVNTPRLFPEEFVPMGDILREIGPEEECILGMIPMYVLTNTKRSQGAGALLYPGVLENCAEQIGTNFYIIPSSVHEVIIVAAQEASEGEKLHEMIHEVNAGVLLQEEILAEYPYFYDKDKKSLTRFVP